MDVDVTRDPGPLVATLARLFASDGDARMVALLANSQISIEQTDWDNWRTGLCHPS